MRRCRINATRFEEVPNRCDSRSGRASDRPGSTHDEASESLQGVSSGVDKSQFVTRMVKVSVLWDFVDERLADMPAGCCDRCVMKEGKRKDQLQEVVETDKTLL